MPITASEIQAIVANEDDFGHELRVGAAIRSFGGFRVGHGSTYKDPNLGKPRQYDYRCELDIGDRRLALAIECKNINPDYPVAICGRQRVDQEAWHEIINTTTRFGTAVRRLDGFYAAGGFVGKNAVRFKADSNKPVAAPDKDFYERWAQALASATDLVKAAGGRPLGRDRLCSAVLPIVVVADHSLWTVNYDERTGVAYTPQQEDACEYFVGHPAAVEHPENYHFSHVHFYTLAGFRNFLASMNNNPNFMRALFGSDP